MHPRIHAPTSTHTSTHARARTHPDAHTRRCAHARARGGTRQVLSEIAPLLSMSAQTIDKQLLQVDGRVLTGTHGYSRVLTGTGRYGRHVTARHGTAPTCAHSLRSVVTAHVRQSREYP